MRGARAAQQAAELYAPLVDEQKPATTHTPVAQDTDELTIAVQRAIAARTANHEHSTVRGEGREGTLGGEQ